MREPLHRCREADEKVQGSETLLILFQSGGGRGLLFQVGQSSSSALFLIKKQFLAQSDFLFFFSYAGLIFRRKLMVPQKEASPLLDKKISELEVKLADVEDDDMEDMDDDDDAPRTLSMPQMQTPLASDNEVTPYTPQVLMHVQSLQTFAIKIKTTYLFLYPDDNVVGGI